MSRPATIYAWLALAIGGLVGPFEVRGAVMEVEKVWGDWESNPIASMVSTAEGGPKSGDDQQRVDESGLRMGSPDSACADGSSVNQQAMVTFEVLVFLIVNVDYLLETMVSHTNPIHPSIRRPPRLS